MQTPPSEDSIPSNYPRPNQTDGRQDLKEVAAAQRQVLYCVLGQLGFGVVDVITTQAQIKGLWILDFVLLIALMGFMLMSVYKLATALGQVAALYVILMFVPCVSLIALLVLSQKATTHLQQAGVKVGLLGANPNSI